MLRKAAGCAESQAKRDHVIATITARGVRLPKPLENTSPCHVSWMLHRVISRIRKAVCPAGFQS